MFQGDPNENQLQSNAKPFTLFMPRNVSLPLKDKVKYELSDGNLGCHLASGVATPWCSDVVVVPRKSGQVHICVDNHALNKNVLGEVHPLPTVVKTLVQMAGATVFSKLDANCGIWQTPLSESCQKLTAFITPFGSTTSNVCH